MAEIVVYTKSYCPFSKECKDFLKTKRVDFDEKMIDNDPALEQEMEQKSDHRTDTPQVFINGHHIGSFDDLKALEATGQLDEMLNK
ncbi:glutaredoxin 3 [Candidatus Peregrinibacteria bacterium]|nr:glutaredoxin 3 [Candidatus Peregrinibacteria bacterium]